MHMHTECTHMHTECTHKPIATLALFSADVFSSIELHVFKMLVAIY